MEVSGVEAGQGQAVAVASEGSLDWSHGGAGGGGVQVVEEMVRDVAGDPSSLTQVLSRSM